MNEKEEKTCRSNVALVYIGGCKPKFPFSKVEKFMKIVDAKC